MARRRDLDAAARAAGMSDEDVSRLTERFYRTKLRVYRDTLRDLADRFTRNGPPRAIPLSQEIKDALRAEAETHALKVASTHNDAVARQAMKIAAPGDGRSKADLERELSRFGKSRMKDRAEMIAVTEAYGPHSDAIASFFRDAGIEPEFDFGGHPDDAPPVCSICRAIIAANPHSLAEVVRIGVPHPFCRQTWHPRLTAEQQQLGDFDLGQSLGGIIGAPSLIQREGGEQEAADSVVATRQ